jgi:hypothetical protein
MVSNINGKIYELRAFVKRVLRKISESKKGGYKRKLQNEEIRDSQFSPNSIHMVRSGRKKRAGKVVYMVEKRWVYRISAGSTEGKKPLVKYSNIHPTRCNVTQFILSGNCSTCFGWYHHPLSGGRTTVSTASGIYQTVTTTCRYSGR